MDYNLAQEFKTIELRTSEEKAEEWSFVLTAMDIPHQIILVEDTFQINVPSDLAEKAETQIQLYEKEILEKKHMIDNQENEDIPVFSVFCVFLLMYIFNLTAFLTSNSIAWVDAGSASSALILKGEWWRTITALTLHADMGHLLSNMIILCIIGGAISMNTGAGLAWFFILLSGIFGNSLNAFVHQTAYISIGSSTASFGAIGILAGIQVLQKNRKLNSRFWVPIIGALSLLAFLGMGPQTDISAHVFGLGFGLMLGLAITIFQADKKYSFWIQSGFAFLSIFILSLGWFMALYLPLL